MNAETSTRRNAAPLLILLLAMSFASAKPLDLQMGARGFGMGGAFVAIANDASATYWNPAGLALVNTLTLSETNWILQDVSGVNVNYFTGVFPITNVGTVAGGWLLQYANLEQGHGATFEENAWLEHAFSLAAGRKLWDKLAFFHHTSIGFSLNRYLLSAGDANGAGTGFDLGVLTYFPYNISLGFIARSLGADMMGDKISPEYRLGLGYQWQRNAHLIVLATDLSTKEDVEYTDAIEPVELNLKGFAGIEYTYSEAQWFVAVRAGGNAATFTSRDLGTVTGGFGGGYNGLVLQYAYQNNLGREISLGQSHRLTVEIELGRFL